MKRFQSAFAVPSGFAVAGKPVVKAARKPEIVARGDKAQAVVPVSAKLRSTSDIRVRAA